MRDCTPSTPHAFDAAGRGAATCAPISFVQLCSSQFYLGYRWALAEGKVFMASSDNSTGRSSLYATGLQR